MEVGLSVPTAGSAVVEVLGRPPLNRRSEGRGGGPGWVPRPNVQKRDPWVSALESRQPPWAPLGGRCPWRVQRWDTRPPPPPGQPGPQCTAVWGGGAPGPLPPQDSVAPEYGLDSPPEDPARAGVWGQGLPEAPSPPPPSGHCWNPRCPSSGAPTLPPLPCTPRAGDGGTAPARGTGLSSRTSERSRGWGGARADPRTAPPGPSSWTVPSGTFGPAEALGARHSRRKGVWATATKGLWWGQASLWPRRAVGAGPAEPQG